MLNHNFLHHRVTIVQGGQVLKGWWGLMNSNGDIPIVVGGQEFARYSQEAVKEIMNNQGRICYPFNGLGRLV